MQFKGKLTLSEKRPNKGFFMVRIFLYSLQTQENTEQIKLRIWGVLRHSSVINRTSENDLISGQTFVRLVKFWSPKFFFVIFTFTRFTVLLEAIIVLNFKENL